MFVGTRDSVTSSVYVCVVICIRKAGFGDGSLAYEVMVMIVMIRMTKIIIIIIMVMK